MKKLFVALMAVSVLSACSGILGNLGKNVAENKGEVLLLMADAFNSYAEALENATCAEDVVIGYETYADELCDICKMNEDVIAAEENDDLENLYPEEGDALGKAVNRMNDAFARVLDFDFSDEQIARMDNAAERLKSTEDLTVNLYAKRSEMPAEPQVTTPVELIELVAELTDFSAAGFEEVTNAGEFVSTYVAYANLLREIYDKYGHIAKDYERYSNDKDYIEAQAHYNQACKRMNAALYKLISLELTDEQSRMVGDAHEVLESVQW
ncbi:MAG: hypothetical protein J6U62_04435 [Bacteroidaceae bacterium]|nr:hypothetical protein [Bacteroidaceae bacterium]